MLCRRDFPWAGLEFWIPSPAWINQLHRCSRLPFLRQRIIPSGKVLLRIMGNLSAWIIRFLEFPHCQTFWGPPVRLTYSNCPKSRNISSLPGRFPLREAYSPYQSKNRANPGTKVPELTFTALPAFCAVLHLLVQ